MKNHVFLPILFLFSCSNEPAPDQNPLSGDSLAVTAPTHAAEGFDGKGFAALALPITVDTSFVMKADTNERLGYLQVRTMTSQGLEGGLEYEVRDYCMIDSLKKCGAYNDYVKKLDIGMVKNSIAFKIGQSGFGAGCSLLLWGIEYSSYEACPYFSGKIIIATIAGKDLSPRHFVVGKRGGAGDPPSTMREDISSVIETTGNISTRIETVNDDLDMPGEEKIVQTFRHTVTASSVEQKQMRTDTLSKEKAAENTH